MKKEHFDEYQVITRQRIAFQSLFITFALVLINGWIITDYMWAPPIVQSIIIVMIPTMYFVALAVSKNAYLSNRTRFPLASVLLFIGIGLLNSIIGISAYAQIGASHYIADGKLTDRVMPLLLGFFFLFVGVIILIKYLSEKKTGSGE